MYIQGRILVSSLLLAISNGETQNEKRDCSQNCNYRFRCTPYYYDPVWAMDDGVCKVFQNSCLFGSINCQRENQCLERLTTITREECQQNCSTCVAISKSPICVAFAYVNEGLNSEEYKTFDNQCLADQFACQNSKPYYFVNPGACP